MRLSLLLIGFALGLAGNLWAASIDVRLLGTVPLDAKPRQLTTTADGQRIYVLTDAGKVLMFNAEGQPQGSFEVGPEVSGITAQGANRLILQMTDRQQMVLVALDPVVDISTEGAPTFGPADAPVTIAVFDDFECPYCARAVPLLKDAQSAYPDKVKLVFKNFPLAMHQHARAAAIASLAAQRQGKFWPLHDLLFENFNKLNPQKIRELAEQAGLDMNRFDQDQKDAKLQQRIDADIQEGQRVGVRGTPTIFVNGHLLQQRSLAALSQLIEAQLAKLTPAGKGGQ
jgi:protein-disulfide isomerase